MKLLRYLLPTSAEIEQLALEETDPAHSRRFEPITRGPLIALLLLAYVVLAAAIVSPLRLITALRRDRDR